MERQWKNSWFPAFIYFLGLVKVPSKELVEPGPITLYGAQWRFLVEMDEGLAAGQHFLVCLKARQLGMSTIMLVLDIFWLYMFPGLRGALIADTADNKEAFRETITAMLDSLPKGFKIPIKKHNRGALILQNGSQLQYMSAGKGRNSGLGRSRGLSFAHCTEISSWGDQEGIDSLVSALATENPNRLFMFESTALGYNVFFTMHKDAKTDPKKRAFFIGWWAKEVYRIPEGDAEYQRWWLEQPVLTEQEQAMGLLIQADYGHTMVPEQWAWWRKKTYERSEQSLLQEYPWHEKVAFQVTGAPFLSLKRINVDMDFISNNVVAFDAYRYEVGDSFLTMKCEQVYSSAEAELRVWEGPVKNARYVIGVDVAYGRSDTADRHAISVWRCFADKMVQVAEWATSIPETRHVAWVLAHLAGSFRDCMINLEVSGPGLTVMSEMKFLRQQLVMTELKDLSSTFNARDALDQARWFLYHRPDTPGQGYIYNWQTNFNNKVEMFNGLRDEYNTEKVIIRSVPLLEEMTTLVQVGASIQASAANKDDRPFAAGLACYAWRNWVRFPMMQSKRTYEIEMAKQREMMESGVNAISGIIPQFFQAKAKERSEAEWQRMLQGN